MLTLFRLGQPYLAVTGIALLLSACAVAPKQSREPLPMPAKFSANGESTLLDRWWLAFDDKSLQQLVDQALTGNFTLQSAWQRLAQAQAVAKKAGAERLPSLDAAVSVNRGTSFTTTGISFDNNTQSFNFAAAYEVDLWGRIRASVRSAKFSYEASQESLHAAAISLTGEVALTWYQLAEQRRQLALLDEQEATNKQTLELVRLRFVSGQAKAADVLQQEELLESVRGERVGMESQYQVTRHRLAALLGRSPNAPLPLDEAQLPALPPLPATGLPAQLVQRRPDLRQAYAQLRAADQDVAVAIAQRLPRLSITGVASGRSTEFSSLFDNWAKNIAANVIAPVFDGGSRKAEVERTRAVAGEAFDLYRQKIVDALGEVENALVQERQQQLFLDNLDRRLVINQRLLDRQRDYYTKGATDYLNVLDALRGLQSLQRQRVQAQRQLVDYRIALYRALAGGFAMDGNSTAHSNEQATEKTIQVSGR